jgi:hypothetical protein
MPPEIVVRVEPIGLRVDGPAEKKEEACQLDGAIPLSAAAVVSVRRPPAFIFLDLQGVT